MKDEIISLYAYNRWANERVLNALRPLSEDDYTK
ncbi:MAG: damage-inducible protein DinB, partial [Acidobacteria bacterium]|nr:damage-inducible protein DinB [Acidobacteriota bacterium]